MICHIIFFVILFGIKLKQLNKLWKKTFKTIHQLSCFVGHPEVNLHGHCQMLILMVPDDSWWCLLASDGF